jgi:hypothetical protein
MKRPFSKPLSGMIASLMHARLDDLLDRRAKTERVTDLVNLDRVRGLLRTIYCRRRYLRLRDERRRAINEANGIPDIVLEPVAPSPSDDENYYIDPFDRVDYNLPESPTSSRRSSPAPGLGPRAASPYLTSLDTRARSPSLSAGSPAMSRRGSDESMLSYYGARQGSR